MQGQPVPFKFKGINNVKDPSALAEGDLVSAVNVDTRDDLSLRRRQGFARAVSLTDGHSMWASLVDDRCYFADGRNVYRFVPPATAIQVATLASRAPVAWAQVNDLVVFVTPRELGFLQDDQRAYPTLTIFDPQSETLENKQWEFRGLTTEWSGQYVCYWNGRLIVASGSDLYQSEPYAVEYYDRRSYILPLPEAVMAVLPVVGGLWVSYGSTIAFIAGDSLDNARFEVKFGSGVIPGSPAYGGTAEQSGWWVTTSEGVLLLGDNGQLKNVSAEVYAPPAADGAAGIVRYQDGLTHYVVALTSASVDNQYDPKDITVQTLEM